MRHPSHATNLQADAAPVCEQSCDLGKSSTDISPGCTEARAMTCLDAALPWLLKVDYLGWRHDRREAFRA